MQENLMSIRSVCVYCGSQAGNDPAYLADARLLGQSIAENGIRLVYGGGTRGIMGAVAESVRKAGGHVTGIIPEFLMDKEATRDALAELDDLIVTNDMHERKHAMFERSDAFITLPGGIGTLEEVIEMMTWGQLGRHVKPVVFANTSGFWDPLLSLLDHMTQAGFIHTAHKVKPLVVTRAEDVIPALLSAQNPQQGENLSGDAAVISRL